MQKYEHIFKSIIYESNRRKPPKLNSYKSDHKTSKMWILPDGKTVALKGLWHYQWILNNLASIKRKYKVDFSDVDQEEQPIRIHAINNGFFRVNYERNGGTLTVEGNIGYFRGNIKDEIFMIVYDNLNSIDNININLMNHGGKVVKNGYSSLWGVPNKQKLDHIPLITEAVKKRHTINEGYIRPLIESIDSERLNELEQKGYAWLSPLTTLYPCKIFEHDKIIQKLPEFKESVAGKKIKNYVGFAYTTGWLRLGVVGGVLETFGYKKHVKKQIPILEQIRNQLNLEKIEYSFIPVREDD